MIWKEVAQYYHHIVQQMNQIAGDSDFEQMRWQAFEQSYKMPTPTFAGELRLRLKTEIDEFLFSMNGEKIENLVMPKTRGLATKVWAILIGESDPDNKIEIPSQVKTGVITPLEKY